jgi:hypothetical protein
MAYKVQMMSNKSGKSTFVFRIKQYVQCELGNHQTSDIKMVEEFTLRTDAVRALANLIADELTLHNVTVLRASNGYAKVFYEYSNGNETAEYKVVRR